MYVLNSEHNGGGTLCYTQSIFINFTKKRDREREKRKEGKEAEREEGANWGGVSVLIALSETHYKWLPHPVTSDKNTVWYDVGSRN